MLYFVGKGYRVIAHDRRGHGRSAQVSEGHDMDHYAADTAAVVEHLDLRNAVHIGHSTGGGEATHYVARHGQPQGRVAKLIIISAVPPIMVKTPANPGGLPIAVFDDLRRALAANLAQFYLDLPSGPFYSFNRPGAKPIPGVIQNWWRQSMMGSANAHYEGIKAFSETDFTEDLKSSTCRRSSMHGDDDQIVPIADSALLSAKLLKNATLKVYKGFPARHVHHPRRYGEPGPARLHRDAGQSRSCLTHGLPAPSPVRSSGTQSLRKILGLRFAPMHRHRERVASIAAVVSTPTINPLHRWLSSCRTQTSLLTCGQRVGGSR